MGRPLHQGNKLTHLNSNPGAEAAPAPRASRWWREPLLHFVVAGAMLFLLFRLLDDGDSGAPRAIVITEAQVEALAENFSRTWMRPPTAEELRGLVEDYIAEEVYYREAIAMGLDRDDTVIRRRLRQKMEFISEGVAEAVEPTDAQLQAYLEQHSERFVEPSRLTFRQVYLSSERRGDAVRRDAERVLAGLAAGREAGDPQALGDATLLPPGMEQAAPRDIANVFGADFATVLDEAPVGQWSGPVQSAFGLHVVHVDQRPPGVAPTLEAIRPIVVREWQAEQKREANAAFLAELRSKYEIRIEGQQETARGTENSR
jgi:hypothetical protein